MELGNYIISFLFTVLQGYDHLALCLVAWYLYKAQGSCLDGSVLRPQAVQTDIFDLFDQEWSPIMVDLEAAFRLEAEEQRGEEGQGQEEAAWWRGNRLHMHPGDVRQQVVAVSEDSEEQEGGKLCSTVRNTDIFVCQFVLHENASFLVDEDTGLLTGFIASVLRGAALGASLICTDAGNTLWPALKKMASLHGWNFWSDAENAQVGHKIMLFGPKSYVMLERVCVPEM
jgi:hypothetical protein